MKFISDSPIPVKIQKMNERVRYSQGESLTRTQHPSLIQRGIDQTCMVLDDGKDSPDFSFMVIGDSGTKPHPAYHPQRKVAELMLPHQDECSFVLHTGDVIYTVGSHEFYPQNFIEPYREFLVGGENLQRMHQRIRWDGMIFKTPILPTLGNHDYYDVPLISRLVAGSTQIFRQFFGYKDFEIGWHGSEQGNAYARAFIDCLDTIKSDQMLAEHLDRYYTAKTDSGRCLRYQPGIFTRVPNRYYTFCYGGIDFFALDSDNLNMPSPIPTTKEGKNNRRELEKRRHSIEIEEIKILEACSKLNPDDPQDTEQLDALRARLNQIDEIKIDIEKQLAPDEKHVIDWEQLNWLKEKLIQSWRSDEVRGRVLYFHHPPYVTEATKWQQAQTFAVRDRLREVFDAVAQTLGFQNPQRPIIDLILNGHAHCLEHLQTLDTGHADSHLNCIISGGSGHRPRRQRQEGTELMETFTDASGSHSRKVADSLLFVGCNGYGIDQRLPYSFIRIDVKTGNPPKFTVRPFVAEWYRGEWSSSALSPFEF